MKKIILGTSLGFAILAGLTIGNISYAGFVSTTAHSRANCATFVESVTWNGKEHHWWRVRSLHTSAKGAQHLVDTSMIYSWRAAAFHAGESLRSDNPWLSQGYHFYADNNGREIFDVYTVADDCRAYDGWWDRS